MKHQTTKKAPGGPPGAFCFCCYSTDLSDSTMLIRLSWKWSVMFTITVNSTVSSAAYR